MGCSHLIVYNRIDIKVLLRFFVLSFSNLSGRLKRQIGAVEAFVSADIQYGRIKMSFLGHQRASISIHAEQQPCHETVASR